VLLNNIQGNIVVGINSDNNYSNSIIKLITSTNLNFMVHIHETTQQILEAIEDYSIKYYFFYYATNWQRIIRKWAVQESNYNLQGYLSRYSCFKLIITIKKKGLLKLFINIFLIWLGCITHMCCQHKYKKGNTGDNLLDQSSQVTKILRSNIKKN
jgi:hypothetical protein